MLDRARQKQMLEVLGACYPNFSTSVISGQDLSDIANLHYLREHELVDASLQQTLSGAFVFSGARITAKGLDFLADDGGLSAILGTITVKLHADSIKELLNARIEASDLPASDKSWLKTQISTLSGEALKTVTKSLVEQGLQRVPDLLAWAQATFHAAP